jgi:peptidoglycan/xylan/chitin deacetylase (PgdA/CDA1 family)
VRLDRFITLNVARPFRSVMAHLSPSPRRAEGRGEVLPILMYHSISRRDESHLGDYFKLCTTPERFRLQMETLKKHGYTATDLETGLEHLRQSAQELGAVHGNGTSPGLGAKSTFNPQPSTLNPRLVVLTFDDGFRNFYTEALPILAEFGFTATVYLPTAFIKDERCAFNETDCLTWSEVRECQKFGIRFGAHTVSHAKLYDLPWPDIEAEVRDCRSDIEAHLGKSVTSFAYPYAFPQADQEFCGRLRETLVASGYQSCVTTIAGRVTTADDPYTLRRLPVNGEDDPELILAKVTGAYDWMAPAQGAVKRIKGMIHNRSRGSALNGGSPLKK